MNKVHLRTGFTLIELTIVMVISGLLIAGISTAVKTNMRKQQVEQTQERLEDIHQALASYVVVNSDLPCPADRTLAVGNASYSRSAADDCRTAPASVLQVDGRVVGGTPLKVRIGAVPAEELGLSAQQMLDGYGHKFLYVVTENLAAGSALFDETKGAIDVIDSAGATVLSGVAGTALYVIISFGPDGRGSYMPTGVAYSGACNSEPGLDTENCDDDATFRQALFATIAGANHFDDSIVHSQTLVGATGINTVCGDQGMVFGPLHPRADTQGCVPDLKVADSGNVGIGTMSPTLGQLQISGNANSASTPNRPRIALEDVAGTGRWLIQGWGPTGGDGNFAIYRSAGTANLLLAPDGNGNVGIGVSNPSEKLQVNGNVRASAYLMNSDIRLKKHVRAVPGLETISLLRGIKFNWAADGKSDVGVIAQDVEKVLPELVVTEPDGYRAVKYMNLIAPLIEAVKELHGMSAGTQAHVRGLEAEVRELRREVERLKESQAQKNP